MSVEMVEQGDVLSIVVDAVLALSLGNDWAGEQTGSEILRVALLPAAGDHVA